jgi:hypothetical protein
MSFQYKACVFIPYSGGVRCSVGLTPVVMSVTRQQDNDLVNIPRMGFWMEALKEVELTVHQPKEYEGGQSYKGLVRCDLQHRHGVYVLKSDYDKMC